MDLYPGQLILELPGASKGYGTTSVTLTLPAVLDCPDNTHERGPITMLCRIVIITLGLGAASMWCEQGNQWPVIQPVHESRTFVIHGGGDTPLIFRIRDLRGVPVYKLECHNGDYEGSSAINFSGDFQCALFALRNGARTSWNLLATDEESQQRSDSLNRGRMTANQLWDDCGANLEYGRVRRFRVRGMQLTFRFRGLQWLPVQGGEPPRLGRFTFEVTAVPDASAESATAERVAVPRPGGLCK